MSGGRRLLSRMLILGAIAAPVGATLVATAGASPAPVDKRVAASEKFVSSDGQVVDASRVGRELGTKSAPSYKGTNRPIYRVKMRTPSATGAGGGSAAETPIAPDRRVQISPTTSYPTRAVTWILFKKTSTGGTFSCTGFMIAPNVVATAGHCVNFGTSGGTGFFYKPSFQIFPGRNGASSPFLCPGGTVPTASQLWSNATWNNTGAETHDYGAITLSCNIGNTVGYFGWTTGGQTNGSAVDTQGYPGDKPSGTQWDADNCSTNTTTFVQCTIGTSSSTQLFYRNDTAGGQSGSPLFLTVTSSDVRAIGIHAYGLHGSFPHNFYNHGTRVNTTVANFFSLMRNGGLV